jgi:hypothetical protein
MAKCGCIRGSYDFSLQQTSCGSLTYIDLSTFQEGEDYTDTPSYEMSAILPDGTIKTYQVTKGIPLSLNFGECVSPGIIEFQVVSCLDKFSKRAALTCSLWCGYLKASTVEGISVERIRELREEILDVELIASTDYITAAKMIEMIERKLDRINCRCQC